MGVVAQQRDLIAGYRSQDVTRTTIISGMSELRMFRVVGVG
jgi:hypothetical protein